MNMRGKIVSSKSKGVLLACALFAFASQAQAILVDTELALVIDVSGSVDATDYALQMSGYEAAFNNISVQSNIDSLTNGLAVEVFFFSTSLAVAGVETILSSAADASAFASTIGSLVRPFSGGTNPSIGMAAALDWIANNNYESSNLVIDVSGDGPGFASAAQTQRDLAEAAGVIINGLAIDDGTAFVDGCNSVTGFYALNIITSDGQCFQATGFEDFENAIIAKIQAETGGDDSTADVPAPATLALLGLGLAGMGFHTRRKAKT